MNQQTLEAIETSLFMVSFDATNPTSPQDKALYAPLQATQPGTTPEERTTAEWQATAAFHGRRARNRWFDKALTFIFFPDGGGGMNGEVGRALSSAGCMDLMHRDE